MSASTRTAERLPRRRATAAAMPWLVGAWLTGALLSTGCGPPQAAERVAVTSIGGAADSPGVDAYGDALPAGVQFRLGTARLKYRGYLYGFDVSRDGRYLVTVDHERLESFNGDSGAGNGSSSGAELSHVRVWNATTGEQVLHLTDAGSAAAFSPDSRQLATPYGIWDVATKRRVRQFPRWGGTPGNDDVAFSADGNMLALQYSRRIVVWDLAAGKELVQITADANIASVSLSPDGRQVASAVTGGNLVAAPRIWDARSGEFVRDLPFQASRPAGPPSYTNVNTVRFSPDGTTLVGADRSTTIPSDPSIHRWNTTTAEELKPLEDIGANPAGIAFSPDGTTLATASSYTGNVALWDVETARELRRFNAKARLLAFTGDGKTLVTAGANALRFWDPETGRERPIFAGHYDRVRWLTFSPDGETLASCSDDGTIRLFAMQDGQQIRTLAGMGALQGTVDFSPDGKLLAAVGYAGLKEDGSVGGGVRVWDVENGQVRHQWNTQGDQVAWFLTDRTMVTSDRFNLYFRDAAGGTVGRTVKSIGQWESPPPVVSENRAVIAAELSRGGLSLSLYSAQTGRIVRDVSVAESIAAKALSPDGKLLAVATGLTEGGLGLPREVAIHLIDVGTGQQVGKIGGYQRSLSCLSFSPDGRTLAAAGYDGTLQLWDASTGNQVRKLAAPEPLITAIGFSPNGRLLATGDEKGTILVWHLNATDAVRDQPANQPEARNPKGKPGELPRNASGVALVEIVEVLPYDERPSDGNKGVRFKIKRIRGTGQFNDLIDVETDFGGLRPPGSPPPKPSGPAKEDSFEKGRRYWVAFASQRMLDIYRQGIIAFWPEANSKIATAIAAAIKTDAYRWQPQYDPQTGLTYGHLIEDGRWRVRLEKDGMLLWDKVIPGKKSERYFSWGLWKQGYAGFPAGIPACGWVFVAETKTALNPGDEYKLPAGDYYVATGFDPETGQRVASWVSVDANGLTDRVHRDYDIATGNVIREDRYDVLDAGGRAVGGKTEDWWRKISRTLDADSGKTLTEAVFRYEYGPDPARRWIRIAK